MRGIVGRDGKCNFPRAWLRRESEKYLAKEEQRGLFRGTRVTLLKRKRLLDGAYPRGDLCDRSHIRLIPLSFTQAGWGDSLENTGL